MESTDQHKVESTEQRVESTEQQKVESTEQQKVESTEQQKVESGRKEGNVLFNDTLNTFYLRLYGIRHMVKDNTDSERGNPLPPHRLLFLISSKGSFICIIPQTG